MTSCTRLEGASDELPASASVLEVTSAADRKEPVLPPAAEVMSTSSHRPVAVPGLKPTITFPFAGLLLNVIDPSVQAVSATSFTSKAPPEPFVTYILNVACETP